MAKQNAAPAAKAETFPGDPVEMLCTHRVTIGLKMPIPHVDYSNINIELSCEGPDRERIIEETKERLYELMDDILGDFAEEPANRGK